MALIALLRLRLLWLCGQAEAWAVVPLSAAAWSGQNI